MDSNQFYDLSVDMVEIDQDSAGRVKILSLNNLQLRSLPKDIGKLTALEQLYLDSNTLTSLPPEIGSLNRLMFLFANNNQLTSIPSEIGNLLNLWKISMNENSLASLPMEITNLEPDGFITSGHMGEIQYFNQGAYFHGNKLCNIPTEIATWLNKFCCLEEEPNWKSDQDCSVDIIDQDMEFQNNYEILNDDINKSVSVYINPNSKVRSIKAFGVKGSVAHRFLKTNLNKISWNYKTSDRGIFIIQIVTEKESFSETIILR